MSYLFTDKTHTPTDSDLANVLTGVKPLWDDLKQRIITEFPGTFEEWAWSGKQYGWSLRLKQKKRAILYMSAFEGYFTASFAVGENAVGMILDSNLPESVKEIVRSGQKYPEGRAVRFEVRDQSILAAILAVAQTKMAN